jgi:hypothetical protein
MPGGNAASAPALYGHPAHDRQGPTPLTLFSARASALAAGHATMTGLIQPR